MSRVWKIDEDGDLALYMDGVYKGSYDPRSPVVAAELRPILERGQAEPLPTMSGQEIVDALRAGGRVQYPAAAPVSDDPLPEGVHRAPDGTLLCQGIDLPESWGFYGPPESIGASEDESRPWWDWRDRETDVRTGHVWYEVRPARSATERVPLVDAPTRKLPDGREIDVALPHDAFVAYTGPVVVVHADADGLVEVLVRS